MRSRGPEFKRKIIIEWDMGIKTKIKKQEIKNDEEMN